jgi:hypothetical protein
MIYGAFLLEGPINLSLNVYSGMGVQIKIICWGEGGFIFLSLIPCDENT